MSKVPDFVGAVHAAGNQRLSVRTQFDAADGARVAAQASDFFRPRDIPEDHEAVPPRWPAGFHPERNGVNKSNHVDQARPAGAARGPADEAQPAVGIAQSQVWRCPMRMRRQSGGGRLLFGMDLAVCQIPNDKFSASNRRTILSPQALLWVPLRPARETCHRASDRWPRR